MSDSFTLPLRAVPEKQDRPDTLPVEISQINNQWGSFRDVNEEILRTQIAEEKECGDTQESEDGDQEKGDVDTTERLEQLYKKRADITQFAVQSHMEAMFALDFISLLLSKNAPRQAETSMSPYLKQIAPLGSLNAEVVNPPPKSETATKDISSVSRGWRIQNFNSASGKLLKAASRLETEVASESRYWNEVLAVKDKGWKVCRLPRERQALGVQYGFLEATAVFRDRGLASLRRSDDGSLILDKGLIPSGARFVRVRVKQGSHISSSTGPFASISNDAESIEHRILQARDSVFEEELFHELVREARSMASSGVTTRQNLIQVPASEDLEIMLDLVDADDESLNADEAPTATDKLLADGLAHSMRILLAFSHRQNLRRRTQVPPPLTSKKRPTPEYHLLRPALAYFQHLAQLRRLESFLHEIFSVLRSSGLDFPELTTKTFTNGPSPPHIASTAPLETLIQKFLAPIESVLRGNLSTPDSFFTVTVRTNLSAPPFGTHYDVAFNFPSFSDVKSPGRLALRDEVEAAISHILLLDVVSSISSHERPSENNNSDALKTWDAIYPQLGELLLSGRNPERHKKMKVILSRHELSLSTYLVRSIDGVGRGVHELRSHATETHTWNSSSSSTASPNKHPSMLDFVNAECFH
ncbi:Mediator complex subunit Med17 [Penicillium verhagenii]|uniref:Mediator complex subunit Med17 n=1 Tax=Penicillium verhagenii TaxID=1562060 RepID=UPI002544EC57|nr:Mediator complex subunit Med17 [Penicillium verhagenii]KAJ5931136.1 Mediator complex subunit Med17 [Penicillium verhagenii]